MRNTLFPNAVYGVSLSEAFLNDEDYNDLLNAYFLFEEGAPFVVQDDDDEEIEINPTPQELVEIFQDLIEEHIGPIPNGLRLWYVPENIVKGDVLPGTLILGYGLTEFPSKQITEWPRADWICWIEQE